MEPFLPSSDDVILGAARPPYPHPQFRLTPAEQAHHGLVWGATGTGKSKLLQSIFLQHLNKGRGVCLIDPHGDLAVATLSSLASRNYFDRPDACDRLIYVDFASGSHVPFNVLAGRSDGHTTALNALEALTRTWPDLHNAPLFRTLFLSSALVLIANGLPLTDLNQLLVDPAFRQRCLAKVDDPLVQQTFSFFNRHETSQAGSTLRRVFLLSFSPIARGVLSQSENLLDLRSFMDEGRSLIVNLGTIPDLVTRRLLGALVMVQIEQAALSRSDIPETARRPWWCLVDEWPSFSAGQGETLDHVLSQARKYQLRLTLAAQSLAQIDSARLAGAFENCHLSVIFRMGYDSAKVQAQHLAHIDPYRVKEEARTPSQRPQYMPRSEQLEEWVQTIVQLPPRHALVKVQGQPPVPIVTLNIPEPALAPGQLDAVVEEYRGRYQRGDPGRGTSEVSALGQTQVNPLLLSATGDQSDFASFFGESTKHPERES